MAFAHSCNMGGAGCAFFPVFFPVICAENGSLATGSSASQSGHFSLLAHFDGKYRFCGPQWPEIHPDQHFQFFQLAKCHADRANFLRGSWRSAFLRGARLFDFS